MGKEKYTYIHNLAYTLAGQHAISADQWSNTDCWPTSIPQELVTAFKAPQDWNSADLRRPLARALLHRHWHALSHRVGTFSEERRGVLCACAPDPSRHAQHTRLCDVSEGPISLEWAGSYMITHIATLAVIAAMTDNLLADMLKKYGEFKRL